MIDVNLWGVIHGIHSFLPPLLANADGGHIVNTASLAGLVAWPEPRAVLRHQVRRGRHQRDARRRAAPARMRPCGVSVLCPGFVRTNIFTSDRNRPAHLGKQAKAPVIPGDIRNEIDPLFIEPAQVADDVLDAVVHDKFWIFTHPEMLDNVATRHDQIMEAAAEARDRATP